MKHEPRLPRDDVNVSKRHPLREAALLLFGAIGLGVLLFTTFSIAVDLLIPYVPRSWEARMLPDLGFMEHPPANEEEEAHRALLESLAERLGARWPDAPEELRIGLLQNEEPNALALPGGLVLVTTGMMQQVESENEIAFVIGHELGHFAGRDHLRSLGRGVAFGLVMAALGRSGPAGDMIGLTSEMSTRRFSREQESRADAFGLELVAAEFSHVNGATDFFDRLPRPGSAMEARIATYLATHPLSDERIAAMQSLAEERGFSGDGPITPLIRPAAEP